MRQIALWTLMPAFLLGLTACDPTGAPSSGTSASANIYGGFPSSGTRAGRYSGSRAGVR
ncbi:hypothetical protein LCL97_17115 [Seohaeicola saemankumensis]|nr:hypothetical protein [Seohaeicola saemankumensis]MCA0872557.1 hypothetical protein [Seohaeicola saemankumensis]